MTFQVKVCSFLLIVWLAVTSARYERRNRCRFGDRCWPSESSFRDLERQDPSLEVILPGDTGFTTAANTTLNLRVTEIPGAVVYSSALSGVKLVVDFSRTHNLDLKMVSSGHEFIGRNIGRGSLLLIVARMKTIETDVTCSANPDGCITVGPGVTWDEAYAEADSVDRVVMGAAVNSVSVTGWSLAGGHAQVTPRLGLGVDQILAVEMVGADGLIYKLDKDKTVINDGSQSTTRVGDTKLFWAVRGGGGGTYGVVTSITYKLHQPPSKFTRFQCTFSTKGAAGQVMHESVQKAYRPLLASLPKEFGGFRLNTVFCLDGSADASTQCDLTTTNYYDLLFWGPWREGRRYFRALVAASNQLERYRGQKCTITQYKTYLGFAEAGVIPGPIFAYSNWGGTFVNDREYTNAYIKDEAEVVGLAYQKGEQFAISSTIIGGRDSTARSILSGATAVNPLFRNARYTTSYYILHPTASFLLPKYKHHVVRKHVKVPGQYYSECEDKLPRRVWTEEFWGRRRYQRLLRIKKKYDPSHLFSCNQCVGS